MSLTHSLSADWAYLDGGVKHGYVWFNKRTAVVQRVVPAEFIDAAYEPKGVNEDQIEEYEAELDKQHEEILDLQGQIDVYKKQAGDCTTQSATLRKELTEVNARAAALQKQLDNVELSKKSESDQVKQLHAEIEKLTSERDQAHEMYNARTAEAEELADRVEQLSQVVQGTEGTLSSQITALHSQLDETKEGNAKLLAENTHLQEVHKKTVADLSATKETLTHKVAELEALANLQRDLDIISQEFKCVTHMRRHILTHRVQYCIRNAAPARRPDKEAN